MKKQLALAVPAAVALVSLPLAIAPPAGPPLPSAGPDMPATPDWQAATAAALGLVAWAIRRFVQPSNFVHSETGALLVTILCATIGALVPVLLAHAFTGAALLSALTSGVTA